MSDFERIPKTRLCAHCRAERPRLCQAKEDILTSQLFSMLSADLWLLDHPEQIPEYVERNKLEAAWPEVEAIIKTARERRCRWVK
ncbi:hypothetical protein KBC80_00455 [Candidatus Woesebacteria bacterium]|jgi:hypothetical protein|nr:hypothetical protein [Candidatus Woesebacteria bacterium]